MTDSPMFVNYGLAAMAFDVARASSLYLQAVRENQKHTRAQLWDDWVRKTAAYEAHCLTTVGMWKADDNG